MSSGFQGVLFYGSYEPLHPRQERLHPTSEIALDKRPIFVENKKIVYYFLIALEIYTHSQQEEGGER